MKTRTLLFTLVLCAFFSCDDDEDSNFYKPRPLQANSPMEFCAVPDKKPIFKIYPHKDIQLLGAGYDITKDYLSFEAVRAPVFDLQLVEKNGTSIRTLPSRSGFPTNLMGEDPLKFLRRVADISRVETYEFSDPLFAGALLKHPEFQAGYAHSSQFSFVSCQQTYTKYGVGFNSPFWAFYSDAELCFTTDFRNDIQNLAPEEIVKKYGTHILKRTGLGMRYKSLFRTTIPELLSFGDKSQSVLLYYTLNKMAEIGIGTGTIPITDERLPKGAGGQLIMEFCGGNTSLLSLPPVEKELIEWFGTDPDETNYALTYIETIPIYRVISDKTKKAQLQEAVKAYIAENTLKVVATVPLIQAWSGYNYAYFNSYEACSARSECKYEGAICSLYQNQEENTAPLYTYKQGILQRLSMNSEKAGSDKVMIGYIYDSPQKGSVPLFEATDGKGYYYTVADKASYDKRGDWRKIGIVGYVMPL